MSEFISEMSKKYNMSEETMIKLVNDVVKRIERDLPQSSNNQIDEEMNETLSQEILRKSSSFQIP